MLNEFVYCPRLCYLEWVQGEFAHSADTLDGRLQHRRVDEPAGDLRARGQSGESPGPEEGDAQAERIHARSVMLSDEELGAIARIDLVETEGARAGCIPILGQRWSNGDFVPAVAKQASAEREHRLSAITGPTHASLFHALLNQRLGSGFDGAAADGEAGLAIGSIVHASSIFPQIGDSPFDLWRRLRQERIETQDATEEKAVLATRQGGFLGINPGRGLG